MTFELRHLDRALSPTNAPQNLKGAIEQSLRSEDEELLARITTTIIGDIDEIFLDRNPSRERLKIQGLMRQSFGQWHRAEPREPWTKATAPFSELRRERIYEVLGIPPNARGFWTDFYKLALASDGPFWQAVGDVINKKLGNAAEDYIGEVDLIISQIREVRGVKAGTAPVKGLVTGHVQSGKTQNMIAVIAKTLGIDFDLVVILAGTKELLRKQTQERFDRDLVGALTLAEEYKTTLGYPEKFVNQVKRIQRFTDSARDLKEFGRIESAPGALDIEELRKEPGLIVTLKNSTRVDTLKELLSDLDNEVSVLLIDDECDEASVGGEEPTELEQSIISCLKVHPNSTYIGYSASPYANLFQYAKFLEEKKDGGITLYPEDFAACLTTPIGYAGYTEYFGVVPEDSDPSIFESHEGRYIRVIGDDDDTYYERAIASWLVAGAVKLWRNEFHSCNFTHHSLLVNSSSITDDHEIVEDDLKSKWRAFLGLVADDAGSFPQETDWFRGSHHDWFTSLPANSKQLLEEAFADFTSQPRPSQDYGLATYPNSLQELTSQINRTIKATYFRVRVSTKDPGGETKESPVLIVNSDATGTNSWEWDNRSHSDHKNIGKFLPGDFQFCKILVGGNMLSRGFTVEGLSTVVIARKSLAVSTLLQMCRWFGFPTNRIDLTRIYLGKTEFVKRNGEVDVQLSGTGLLERFQIFAQQDQVIRAFIEERSDTWTEADPLEIIREVIETLDPSKSKGGHDNDADDGGRKVTGLKLAGSISPLLETVLPRSFIRPFKPTFSQDKADENLVLLQNLLEGKKLKSVRSEVVWNKGGLTSQAASWLISDSSYEATRNFIENFVPDGEMRRDVRLLLTKLDHPDILFKVACLTLENQGEAGSVKVGNKKLNVSYVKSVRGLQGIHRNALLGATSSGSRSRLINREKDQLWKVSGFGQSKNKVLVLAITVQKVARTGVSVVTPTLFLSEGFIDGVKIR